MEAVQPLQPPFTTRARFRADLRADLEGAIKLATLKVGEVVNDPEATPVELSDAIAAIPVVTRAAIDEAITQLFGTALPPPAEREAEVRTPSVLNVWARCPNCGIHMVIPLQVTPQLVLDDGGTGELKLKAKSKGRIHACNQLTLDEPEGQLRTFSPDVRAGSDVEDVSEDAAAATPGAVYNLLLLVQEEFPAEMPSLEGVEGWDQVTLELVADWASAVHLRASDHEVEIPDLPAVLSAPADPDAPTPITRRRVKTAEAEPAPAEVADAGTLVEAIAEVLPDVENVLAGEAVDAAAEPEAKTEICGAGFGADLTCTLPAFHEGDHDDLPF